RFCSFSSNISRSSTCALQGSGVTADYCIMSCSSKIATHCDAHAKEEEKIQCHQGGKSARARHDRRSASSAADSYSEGIAQGAEAQAHSGKDAGGGVEGY